MTRPTCEQVEVALQRAEHGGGKTPPLTTDVLAAEVHALRADLGMEQGMRAAAVDELETLRRELWAALGGDQMSDEHVRATVARHRAISDAAVQWADSGAGTLPDQRLLDVIAEQR